MSFRAMDCQIFKTFKTQSWPLVKADYLINDQGDDHLPDFEDLFGNILCDSTMPTLETSASTNMVQTFTSAVEKMSNEMKDEIKKQTISSNLLGIFRFFICFESNPTEFFNCLHCGRYLGCFSCFEKLDKCPICRKVYKCKACGLNFPKKGFFVPGLPEFLKIETQPTKSSTSTATATVTSASATIDLENNQNSDNDFE